MTTGNASVFEVKKGKDGPECQNFIRMVNNRSVHSPTYKISREMFQIPHKMTDLNKLSAALKQLCMYLKYHELQGQKQMISGDFTELPNWVNYWIRSGVSPLILLAACVFASRQSDPTLSDPNFIHATIDSLRNMYDGAWGRIAVDSSMLGGPVVAKCNRFMTAWCAKAMGGEGSREHNLLTECMFNNQVDEMKGFTLEWVRIFWNRFGEVIRDPVLGPSSSTTLAQFLDRNQPITRGMLSNIIFDRCRETCWYIVQGHISPVDTMMSRLSGSPSTFDQLRPRLAVWMHFRDALRRCGRITAVRKKEYSLKDIILILGRRKECGDTDIADQVCLAYGHAVLHGIHLLDGYGIAEVDNVYPLVRPGYSTIPNEEVVQIRSLLANERRDTLQWFSFPREMIQFQTASAQSALDLGGVNVIYYSRLMEQISEYGNVLSKEVDESHGVNRKFYKYDPIDAFPMLDSDLDLSDDAIGSQFVKKIPPSFQEQMVAKHIRRFMNPDTSSREALPLVKKFLKDNPQGSTTSTGVKGGGQATVTEKFYTFWQDEFPDVQSAPAPPRDVPSAPQGPSASTTTRTTMRSATVTIEETVFSMKPLICVLHTRAAVASSRKSVTRNLDVKAEHDIVLMGQLGISHT